MNLAPLLVAAAAGTLVAGVALALVAAAWTRHRDRSRARVALDQRAVHEQARARRLIVLCIARIEAAHALLAEPNHQLFDDEPIRLLTSTTALVDHALAHASGGILRAPIVSEALLAMRAVLQQCVDVMSAIRLDTGMVTFPRRPPPPPRDYAAERAGRKDEVEWRLHTARRILGDLDRGQPPG